MMFQMTFAIITPALITGAFAERMKFSAMLWFMGLWGVVVYAPIAHWVWGAGGCSSAWARSTSPAARWCTSTPASPAWSPRWCSASGSATAPEHGAAQPDAERDRRLAAVGRLVRLQRRLGGAANGRAGMAMVVTQVAAAAAALAWMFVGVDRARKPTVLGILSGAVAGLVAITPAAGFVDPMGALIIGLVAGVVCFWAATSLKHSLGYDDAWTPSASTASAASSARC